MPYNDIVIVPPIIAHRGRSAVAPENTLIAFQKAKECGLKWIEFDVTLAACGEVVIIHDDTLRRTVGVAGNVNDFTYQSLQTMDAGSWFSPTFRGEKIPTLKMALDFLKYNQMSANIEIKSYAGKEPWVIERVLQVIKNYHDCSLLLSSFSKAMLIEARKQDAEVPLGFLMDVWDKNYQSFIKEISAVNIGVNQRLLSANRVKQLKATGLLLTAYTVNNVARAKKLFSFGVDAIFSDYPEEMFASFSSSM